MWRAKFVLVAIVALCVALAAANGDGLHRVQLGRINKTPAQVKSWFQEMEDRIAGKIEALENRFADLIDGDKRR